MSNSPLPEGLTDVHRVPPIEQLEGLTDEEIYLVIRYHSTANYASVGMQFWIDELARRRTARILERIVEVTAEDAEHVRRMASIIEAGGEQNAEMVKLNRRMFWLSLANTILAAAAVVVAVVAVVVTQK